MTDQADHLRKLVRDSIETQPSLAPGIPLFATSGSNSAADATTLVLDAAQELASLGKRVVLVDANLDAPSLRKRQGDSCRCYLENVLSGDATVKESLHSLGDGLQLLPGKPMESTPPELNQGAFDRLLAQLNSLHSLADIILVDTGNGMTPWVQNWWQAAGQIVLVTSCDEQAIKDAYTMIKLASRGNADNELRLVVNQCDNEASAVRVTERFAATCLRFLGVGIVESKPVPATDTDQREYQRAVRLLASDLLTASLVSYRRISGMRSARLPMPALPEKLDHSLKHLQQLA